MAEKPSTVNLTYSYWNPNGMVSWSGKKKITIEPYAIEKVAFGEWAFDVKLSYSSTGSLPSARMLCSYDNPFMSTDVPNLSVNVAQVQKILLFRELNEETKILESFIKPVYPTGTSYEINVLTDVAEAGNCPKASA